MDGKRFGAPFPLAAGKKGIAARAEVVCGKRFVDVAPWLGRFWIALAADGTFLSEEGVQCAESFVLIPAAAVTFEELAGDSADDDGADKRCGGN